MDWPTQEARDLLRPIPPNSVTDWVPKDLEKYTRLFGAYGDDGDPQVYRDGMMLCVGGPTYYFKGTLKAHHFKWDPDRRRWWKWSPW